MCTPYDGVDSEPFVVNFCIDGNKISLRFKNDYNFYPFTYKTTNPKYVDRMIELAESHEGLNEFMSRNNIRKPRLRNNP